MAKPSTPQAGPAISFKLNGKVIYLNPNSAEESDRVQIQDAVHGAITKRTLRSFRLCCQPIKQI